MEDVGTVRLSRPYALLAPLTRYVGLLDCGRQDLNFPASLGVSDKKGFRQALAFEELFAVTLNSGLRCHVCRGPFRTNATQQVVHGVFEFAHVIPKSHGGKALSTNAKLLCRNCHGIVTVRVPHQAVSRSSRATTPGACCRVRSDT